MLEIEVKFAIVDLRTLRTQLLEHGAIIKKDRVFERNVRYDDASGSLLTAGSLLRLRLDTQAKITWKGIPANIAALQSEVKVREEIEIVVSDFDAADLIIQRLGFAPVQSYEKYRETFQLDDVEVVLDEMPYGNFVELEGPELSIRQLAGQLGFDWQRRIVTNYLGLLNQFNQTFETDINDLTFANFSQLASAKTQFAATLC